jgi:hypothetical protein
VFVLCNEAETSSIDRLAFLAKEGVEVTLDGQDKEAPTSKQIAGRRQRAARQNNDACELDHCIDY